jgi:hypothetical protein
MPDSTERRVTEHEARALLARAPDAEQLADLFSLAMFWQKAVFDASYATPDALLDHLALSPLGIECIEACCRSTNVARPDAALAIFGQFSWLQPLVDVTACNVEGLSSLLTTDLHEGRIRLSYQWGRELSDRIQARPHLAVHDRIPHAEAWRLLENMPIGIFQHGCFVSGPLGIIRSPERRWYPVQSGVAFGYLSNGSRNWHGLGFDTAKIGVVRAFTWISRFLQDRCGPESEWNAALSFFGIDRETSLLKHYLDAPLMVAECLSTADKSAFIAEVLKSDLGAPLRERLRGSVKLKACARLPPNELVKKLSAEAVVQLTHALTTPQIVAAVEKCIADDIVTIPATEVRVAKHKPPDPWPTFKTEMGRLGLRPGFSDPAARLLRVVTDAYSTCDALYDLRWHLGAKTDENIPAVMLNLLRTSGPADVVEKLVLASPSVARNACTAVGLPLEAIAARDATAIDRFLWKCGFEIRTADAFADSIRDKAVAFEQFVQNIDFTKEENREDVRGQANPLFVQLENFLDKILCLNVWCTTQDHWQATRFEFRLKQARRCVSEVLEPLYGQPTGAPPWDPERSSTLGTQLFYLSSYERLIEACQSADRSKFRREDADKVVDRLDRPLAFRHVQFWADANPANLESYARVLADFSLLLRQGDVAGVRNGLDHWREFKEFPTCEMIVGCCKKLSLAIRLAEDQHLLPVLYWLNDTVQHVHLGFSEHSCRSATRSRTVIRPSTKGGMPDVPWQSPVVFSPLQLNDAVDVAMFFKAPPESPHAEYWAGYPQYASHDPRKHPQESFEPQFAVPDQTTADAHRSGIATDRVGEMA